jgi:PLP dependent protein
MTIADNVTAVCERVATAAKRSGREAAGVTVVCAVKTVESSRIEEAVAAGLVDLGENDSKDLAHKAACISAGVRWHYLGSIQTNKVKHLDSVVLVHGVDREREAQALDRRGETVGRQWDVLIEVNLAGEATKQGVAPSEVDPLLERLRLYPHVRPRGFMFVAPQAQNPEDVRWMFAEGRKLRDRYRSVGLDELSMGMSDDFEVAIEEGATIVRIGRAIFGERRKAGDL